MAAGTGRIAVVTGINGYIASVLGHALLEAGYTVRGTSRSVKSTDALRNGAYKSFGKRFEPYEVPDMLGSDAFNAVVKGAHVIFHTASPVVFDLLPWPFFRDPAVKGATNILDSAQKHAGTQLEAVVVTSSTASANDTTKDYISEETWNDLALEAVESQGDDAPPGNYYAASKVAAEKAVWKWVETNKPAFSVSTVLPSVVTGPPVQPPEDPAKLNVTLLPLWNMFSGAVKEIPANIGTAGYVDVRDIAALHQWCAEHPDKSRGERFVAMAGHGPYQAQSDILREAYPDRKQITLGNPGSGYTKDRVFPEGVRGPRTKKMLEVTGIPYRSLETAVLDTAAEFVKRYT